MNMTNGISSFNEHRPSSPDNDLTARSRAFGPRSMTSDAQSRAMEDWQQALLRSIAGDGDDDTSAHDAQGKGQGCHGQGSQHTHHHHNHHDRQSATGPTMRGGAPIEGSDSGAMPTGNGATPACGSHNANARPPQDAIAPDGAQRRMFL